MKTIIAAFLVATAVPTAALAVQQPAPVQIQDRMDGTDRPSRVQTRATIGREVQSFFARVDRNRDGVLTRDEAQAGRKAFGQRAGMRGQPRAGNAMAAFDRLDLNRDGVINRQEFGQAQALRAQRRAARADRPMRGMRGMRFGGRMFEMADANRDGRLTIQEATAAAYRRFDASDLNRDGQLTPEERRQSRANRAPRRG